MRWGRILKAAAIALCPLVFLSGSVQAYAEDSYIYDSSGKAVPSRAGYKAMRSVSGNELGCGDFSEPADIFRSSSGEFFIADSGNDRIVRVDSGFTESAAEYSSFIDSQGGRLTLSSPGGIYVSDEGLMYVADTGNSRIIVSDMECNIKTVIERPAADMYENETFRPCRVLADKDGNIYSVVSNMTGGAAFFRSSGEYSGSFGANSTEPTIQAVLSYLRKLFSTDKMRESYARSTPAGITSFDIDSEGFVYTVSESDSVRSDRIKKVGAAGVNLFSRMGQYFGDTETDGVTQTRLVDIDVDEAGRICCLDAGTGRIFQYDEGGGLLFIFGEQSERLGGFSLNPTAIETSDNCVYVTDGMKNTVTIFEETDFGRTVRSAVTLYNDGYYEEALEPWYEVLRQDGNYMGAYRGISSALLCKGDYKGAMEYAELGGSSYHYNKAFECWRDDWLGENFKWLAAAAVIFTVICTAAGRLRKKRRTWHL